MNRSTRLGVVALSLAAAACSEPGTKVREATAPNTQIRPHPSDGSFPPVPGDRKATPEQLEICKAGSSATILIKEKQTTVRPSQFNITSASYGLTDGQCEVVADHNLGDDLTYDVSETGSQAGYALDSIRVTDIAGNVSVATAGNTVSLSKPRGASSGWLVEFFNSPTGTLGNFVWLDQNANGIQDAGEPGIAGVTVTLAGPVNATTTTDAQGAYSFTKLPPGDYTVSAATPTGTSATTVNASGSTNANDSNDPAGASVTLAPGGNDDTIDFGFRGLGKIGDFVWLDLNGNGVQESGEPGLPGATVTLAGPVSATTTTDNNGAYLFSGLPAGSYTVSVTPPSGETPTTQGAGNSATDSDNPAGTSVTLATNDAADLTIDFGFRRFTGQIGDYVWLDVNGNGIQDSGEAGIAGATVELSGPGGFQSTTTDASGGYLFSGLQAGNYTVTATTPAGGFAPTTAHASGSNANNDSNGSPASVTLATDDATNFTIDFGFLPPPSGEIGDFVWKDVNGNGIQDSGEPGIPGVTVTLGGAASATTTTDASGQYLFQHLSAGTYTVSVSTPSFMTASPSNASGSNSGNDSNGSPETVTLATNLSTDYTIDFGFVPPTGHIGDFVWNDLDGDGQQESGEAGIAGVTVTLNGPTGPASTVTDASGFYGFSALPAGNYTVTVNTPSGYVATGSTVGNPTTDSNGSPASVTLSTGETDNSIDFGFYRLASVGDRVWKDLDGDGVQDVSEPGIAGVTVTLSGTSSATTTTDANGFYSFDGMRPGSYTVTVTAPAGYAASPANQGGDQTKDSNLSPSSVTLVSGQANTTIDFGFVPPLGEIGDYVWRDLNANGIQDAGEPGIAGVTVKLSGSATATTTTDASGKYLFSGLAAGSYTVTSTTPSGLAPTTSNAAGSNANNDSNGSPAAVTLSSNLATNYSIDFGYIFGNGGKCVATIGYWKTHSASAPGGQADAVTPRLPIWLGTPLGAKSVYVTTSAQAVQLLSMQVGSSSNGITKLYAQMLGAKLGIVNGANGAPIASTISAADAFLATHNQNDWSSLTAAQQTQVLTWMTAFDNFNNGKMGSPHC